MLRRLSLPVCLMLTVLLGAAPGWAQQSDDANAPSVELDSPHATVVEAFLPAMERIREGRGDVDEAWATVRQTLATDGGMPEAFGPRVRALYEVLRKVGLPDEGLPTAAAVQDHRRYVLFPQSGVHTWVWQRLTERGAESYSRTEVVLEANAAGEWRFTEQTLIQAPGLAEALAPLPPTRLEAVGEDPALTEAALNVLGSTFTDTPTWGWGALLGCIFLGLAAGRVAQAVCRRAADRLRRRQCLVRATVFEDLASPLSLTLLTVGITVGLFGFIRMDERVEQFAGDVLAFLYLFALGWFLFNLVDVVEVGLRRLTARSKSKLDDTLVPLLRKTLRIFLVIVFTLVIAQNIFGLNITGWLAGLGIAGLAVSLAAQDSVKNLFGSLMIYFDKPFSIGDWIIFDGHEGYVEEIGFRSTRLRLWSRHQVTIPNMKFNDGNVTNVARRPLDRRVMSITITYDTPPDKIEQAVQILDEILHEPEIAEPFDFDNYPPHIAFDEFNDASLNIRVYYYFMLGEGRNYWSYFEHRHLVNMRIVRRFNEAGIDFAFPTQTLHLAGDPKRELSIKLLESDGNAQTSLTERQ